MLEHAEAEDLADVLAAAEDAAVAVVSPLDVVRRLVDGGGGAVDRRRARRHLAGDGRREFVDAILIEEVEELVLLAAVHPLGVEQRAQHLADLRPLSRRVGADDAAEQRVEELALRALLQDPPAQHRRLVVHGGDEDVEGGEAEALARAEEAARQGGEEAELEEAAVELSTIVELQLLRQPAELVEQPDREQPRLVVEARVVELRLQRGEVGAVVARVRDDLHVVDESDLVQRGERMVVERARQHDVLEESDVVVLVDPGGDAVVGDRDHLCGGGRCGEVVVWWGERGRAGVRRVG